MWVLLLAVVRNNQTFHVTGNGNKQRRRSGGTNKSGRRGRCTAVNELAGWLAGDFQQIYKNYFEM